MSAQAAANREGPLELPVDSGATLAALDREVAATQETLGGRTIASLVDLPVATDPDIQTMMRSLTTLWAPAYISGNQNTARLISATMVRLSLEHGNTEDSACGYVTHAITIGPIRGDYQAALQWGELALVVNDRFGDAKRRAKIHQQFQAHVSVWCRPLQACLPHAREALRSGLEAGDFTYAGYGAATEAWAAWLTCRSIDGFLRDYTSYSDLLGRLKMEDFRESHHVLLAWARSLQGRTTTPTSLTDEAFDEQAFAAKYEAAPFFLAFLDAARLHLHLVHDEPVQALAAARRARAATVEGIIWPVLIDAWAALAIAGHHGMASDAERRGFRNELDVTQVTLSRLAGHCPETFQAWAIIVSGARHRLDGRAIEAAECFETAAATAGQVDQLSVQALACDHAARVWAEIGDEARAAPALREAHRAYAAWGAHARVERLEREHAATLQDARLTAAPPPAPVDGAAAAGAALDTTTVMKVAHAVSREVELDGLMRRLVELAVENAGAERGLFLQVRDGALVVQAEADAGAGRAIALQATPLEHATDLSQGVARYVQRTGQPVVLEQPGEDDRFAGDPYFERVAVRSVLCIPVEQQGQLAGVLYLENRLTSGAFTPARLEIMRLLTSQAAIALDNARLYDGLRTEVARRTAAERALRAAMGELEILKNRLEAENVYLQEEIRTQHNFDEEQAVAHGRFRADLLYRLNVFPVDVPPLRSRASDIPLLVAFFVAGLARKLGKPVQGFSARSMEWMRRYDWHGNVRELQNVVEGAAIRARGPVLEVESNLLGLPQTPAPVVEPPPAMDGTLDDVQRAHIRQVLQQTGGVIEGGDGAARRLGLHPNTLRSRLKKLGLAPSTFRPPAPRA